MVVPVGGQESCSRPGKRREIEIQTLNNKTVDSGALGAQHGLDGIACRVFGLRETVRPSVRHWRVGPGIHLGCSVLTGTDQRSRELIPT